MTRITTQPEQSGSPAGIARAGMIILLSAATWAPVLATLLV